MARPVANSMELKSVGMDSDSDKVNLKLSMRPVKLVESGSDMF